MSTFPFFRSLLYLRTENKEANINLQDIQATLCLGIKKLSKIVMNLLN